MLSKILFVGRTTAENTPGWNNWAVVSISDPESNPASLIHGWYAVHRAVISDSAAAMTVDEAIKIIDYIYAVSPFIEGFMVHCKGGISRSAAVAKWIAEAFNLPFNHRYESYNKFVYNQLHEAAKVRARRPNNG